MSQARTTKSLPHPAKARLALGLTQAELAARAGVDVCTISRGERAGTFPSRLSTRRKVLEALGLRFQP